MLGSEEPGGGFPVSEQLTVDVEFIHRDDRSGSFYDELPPDGEQDPTSLEDFFRELIIDAVVGAFQLPSSALNKLLLLVLFEFDDDRSRSAVVFLPSQPVGGRGES